MEFVALASGSGIPIIVPNGHYPLYDVTARIVDLSELNKASKEHPGDTVLLFEMGNRHIVDAGNLSPGAVWSQLKPMTFSDPEHPDFNIFFSARNGLWTEVLRIRKVNNDWLEVLKVFQGEDKRRKTLYTSPIPPQFPRDALNWK